MQFTNTKTRYGLIAKSLHWLIAILIIAAWGVGIYASEFIADNDPSIRELFDLHKSTGMAVLMLAVIRLSWRLYNNAPGLEPMPKVMALAAHSVHYLLYAFMFIQPLSGWAMSSAAGYPPNLFGLFTFPDIVAKSQDTVFFYKDLHNVCAYILLALFVLHVSGALFHHFVMKDNTLRRMTFGKFR
mgnify:CR=1 FL=1